MHRCLATVLVAALPVLATSSPPAAATAPPRVANACSAAAYHRLDFWLGDWDTFDTGRTGETSQARNRVTSMLGGCAIRERYVQNDGLVGESFTIYDAGRRLWHQTWVTNRGSLLTAEGSMHDRRLVLEGVQHDADGRAKRVRVAWWPVPGGVRERAEKSTDGGSTWGALFDITFRPHRNRRP